MKKRAILFISTLMIAVLLLGSLVFAIASENNETESIVSIVRNDLPNTHFLNSQGVFYLADEDDGASGG